MKQVKGSLGGIAAAVTGASGRSSPAQMIIETVNYIGDQIHNGARENASYSAAKVRSNNAVGLTNDQIQEKVVAISKASGITQARGAEAIEALIATGKVLDSRVLDLAVVATAEQDRLSKIPAANTAAKFAKLAMEPSKASIELNNSNEFSNYLKPGVLKEIQSLEDQGKMLEAAALAQLSFAEPLIQRTRGLVGTMTAVDRFSLAMSDVGDAFEDRLRGLGRPSTKQEQIADRTRAIDHYRDSQNAQGGPMYDGSKHLVARLTAEKKALQEAQERDVQQATSEGQIARTTQAAIATNEKARSDSSRERDNQGIAMAVTKQLETSGLIRTATSPAANQGGSVSKGAPSAGIRRAEVDGLRPCIAAACCDCQAGTTGSAKQGSRRSGASESPSAADGGTAQPQTDAEQKRQKELIETMRKATSSVADQTTALEAQNVAYGKTKSAVQELNIAQLERQYQDLDNTENVIPGYLDALGARIDAEKKLLTVTRNAEGIETADKEKKKNDDKAKKLSDDIGGAFREGFVNLLEGKDNALDKLGESLKKKITASVADALYDATLKPAVEAFSNWLPGAFKGIFSGGSGGGSTGSSAGSGGSWFGSLVSGVMSIFGIASAKGNVFASPGLHTYANSVVSQPTFFPFASGIGLMGEAGPEAIMPLRRGADGRLGVSAPGGGGNAVPTIQFAPSNVFHIDARSDRGAVMADMQRLLAENNRGQMEQLKRVKVLPQ